MKNGLQCRADCETSSGSSGHSLNNSSELTLHGWCLRLLFFRPGLWAIGFHLVFWLSVPEVVAMSPQFCFITMLYSVVMGPTMRTEQFYVFSNNSAAAKISLKIK